MRASTNHRLLNNICPIQVIVFPFNKLTYNFSRRIHVIHNKTPRPTRLKEHQKAVSTEHRCDTK